MSKEATVEIKRSPRREEKRGQFVEILEATIRKEDLGKPRSNVSYAVKKTIGPIGNDFHYGHLIASLLGGSGQTTHNVIPQWASLNLGNYKSMETHIKNRLMDDLNDSSRFMEVQIVLFFEDSSTKVPNKIFFQFRIIDKNGKCKLKGTEEFINGQFTGDRLNHINARAREFLTKQDEPWRVI